MKVSSKIVSAFLVLMLLAVVVLGNQLTVISQMQKVNRDLFEFDLSAATERISCFLADQFDPKALARGLHDLRTTDLPPME